MQRLGKQYCPSASFLIQLNGKVIPTSLPATIHLSAKSDSQKEDCLIREMGFSIFPFVLSYYYSCAPRPKGELLIQSQAKREKFPSVSSEGEMKGCEKKKNKRLILYDYLGSGGRSGGGGGDGDPLITHRERREV